ncbi:MAG: hypothetical protein ACI4PH_00860 [Faecousia sp.]
MTDHLPAAGTCPPTLPAMLRKVDRLARQSRFTGKTAEEFAVWHAETKQLLQKPPGLDKMELCPPQPVYMDDTWLEDRLLHEVCSGPHRWHGEHLREYLSLLWPCT